LNTWTNTATATAEATKSVRCKGRKKLKLDRIKIHVLTMDLTLIIEILRWVIPIVISLGSLIYAVKQRNIVKKEISKKGYLENAITCLSAVIHQLEKIEVPNLSALWEDVKAYYSKYPQWENACFGTYLLATDILRASFNMKTKKIDMEVEYIVSIQDRSEGAKKVSNLNEFEPKWFIDLTHSNKKFSVTCNTNIKNYKRDTDGEPEFDVFEDIIILLKKSQNLLLDYEEVYEMVSPNLFKKVNCFVEDVTKEIFKVIRKPKHIELDLNEFADSEEIKSYVFEEILNYSQLASKFSKISEVVSELVETRKELFLKIS